MYRFDDWKKSLDLKNWKNDNTIKAKPKNYPKDSFDRFGDDLVRLLLSYHSFDDRNNTIQKRCRHECVSKQFQRVIYDTIIDFYIEDSDIFDIKDTDISVDELWHKLIAFVQKKCPNIQRVVFFQISIFCLSRNMRPLFAAIDQLRNNWPELKTLDIDISMLSCKCQLDLQVLQYLFTTFGSMVTHFAYSGRSLLPDLSDCPNLSHLSIQDIQSIFTTEGDNQLFAFNRLKEVTFEYLWLPLYDLELNNQSFQIFTDYYKTRLQCLVITFIDGSNESQSMVTQFMTQLTQFRELKELGFRFRNVESFEYSICGYLKTIGIKCEKLKKFSLDFSSDDTALNIEILNAMKYMSRLKRLDLNLYVHKPKAITDWTQLQPLNSWPQLTHLSIELWDLSQEMIEHILSNQFRLQTLDVMDSDNNIDSQWLLCISRLSSLESMVIYTFETRNLRFKKSDLLTIFEKCSKMRSIEISGHRFSGEDFDEPNDCKFADK